MLLGELCYLPRGFCPVFYDIAGLFVEMPDPLQDTFFPLPCVVITTVKALSFRAGMKRKFIRYSLCSFVLGLARVLEFLALAFFVRIAEPRFCNGPGTCLLNSVLCYIHFSKAVWACDVVLSSALVVPYVFAFGAL